MSNPILPEFNSLQLEAANEKTSGDRPTELTTDSNELARQVALNPSTPPDVLRKLANSSDAITRKNITGNPNTPTEVLLNLGGEFPEQLLNNSIFSLLLLENPNLVDEIPLATLRSLLKCETVPVSFLEQAANNSDMEVQLAVATNVQTPQTVLAKLMHGYGEVANAARLHVTLAGEMTSGWHEAALEMIQTTVESSTFLNKYGACLFKRGLIPEFLFDKLAKGKSRNIRFLVAGNPNTPVHLLEHLVQDSDGSVRSRSARNPNLPVHLLEQLAQNNNRYIRRGIAQNPNTPAHLLEQLAQDDDNFVRYFTVSNPSLPVKLIEQVILSQLAQKPNKAEYGELDDSRYRDDKGVREGVASNPNTPVQLLELLAQDEAEYVRSGVALNPNTPIQLLELLAQDEAEYVRRGVASNPNTPVQLLELLAQDEAGYVRSRVASNPNTPVQLLELLAQDEAEYNMRSGVALNPNTPVQLLELLAQDNSCDIHHCLVSNPNFPIKFLLELVSKYDDAQSSTNPTPSLSRIIVLLHPQTPQEVLAENSRSLVWLERYAVAHNSNTPPNILKALAKDANRIVRAAAKANLQRRNHKP